MVTVETTTKAQKLETAALKTAMDKLKTKLDSQVMFLTQQKASLDAVNSATAKHHQTIEDLKKCLEKVEKSRDEQKATIDKLNTVTTKVTGATNVLRDATTKQNVAFNKLKTVTHMYGLQISRILISREKREIVSHFSRETRKKREKFPSLEDCSSGTKRAIK